MSWKLEVGSWKLEVGSWKLEVGSWKLEVGSWKLEVGSWSLTALEPAGQIKLVDHSTGRFCCKTIPNEIEPWVYCRVQRNYLTLFVAMYRCFISAIAASNLSNLPKCCDFFETPTYLGL